MPAYSTSGSDSFVPDPVPPIALGPGDSCYMFGVGPATMTQDVTDANVLPETVVVGERSIAITCTARPGGGAPAGLIIQLFANGNPGGIEVDLQDAGVNAEGFYETPLNAANKITVWTQEGANWVSYAEFQPEAGKFNTLLVVALPNAVKIWAKASYI